MAAFGISASALASHCAVTPPQNYRCASCLHGILPSSLYSTISLCCALSLALQYSTYLPFLPRQPTRIACNILDPVPTLSCLLPILPLSLPAAWRLCAPSPAASLTSSPPVTLCHFLLALQPLLSYSTYSLCHFLRRMGVFARDRHANFLGMQRSRHTAGSWDLYNAAYLCCMRARQRHYMAPYPTLLYLPYWRGTRTLRAHFGR